jgi:hypothetical protein
MTRPAAQTVSQSARQRKPVVHSLLLFLIVGAGLGAYAANAQTLATQATQPTPPTQPARQAGALAAPAAAPAPLGSLILSPAQRRNLETGHRLAAAAAGRGPQAYQPPIQLQDTLAALPEALTISGIVTRADNRSTIWVNNQPRYGAGVEDPLRTLASQVAQQNPGASALILKAKPGQALDTASRTAIDSLPPGSITIIPPLAAVNAGVKAIGKKEK